MHKLTISLGGLMTVILSTTSGGGVGSLRVMHAIFGGHCAGTVITCLRKTGRLHSTKL